jgi:hypothetical protein
MKNEAPKTMDCWMNGLLDYWMAGDRTREIHSSTNPFIHQFPSA